MTLEAVLEFPEINIETNFRHLEALRRTNPLVKRVYEGETTFLAEAQDLFYFFQGRLQALKGALSIPKLQQNHEERLGHLEEAVNAVNLMTVEEMREYAAFKRDAQPVRFGDGFTLYNVLSLIHFYEGMQGSVSTGVLHANRLSGHLRHMRFSGLVFPAIPWVPALQLRGISDVKDSGELVFRVFFGAVLPLAMSSGFIWSTMKMYTPPQYYALHAKAERLDYFIQKYSKFDYPNI